MRVSLLSKIIGSGAQWRVLLSTVLFFVLRVLHVFHVREKYNTYVFRPRVHACTRVFMQTTCAEGADATIRVIYVGRNLGGSIPHLIGATHDMSYTQCALLARVSRSFQRIMESRRVCQQLSASLYGNYGLIVTVKL